MHTSHVAVDMHVHDHDLAVLTEPTILEVLMEQTILAVLMEPTILAALMEQAILAVLTDTDSRRFQAIQVHSPSPLPLSDSYWATRLTEMRARLPLLSTQTDTWPGVWPWVGMR